MIHFLSRQLANVIFAMRPSREPDFLIGPSKEDPYMKRWWIIPRNRWFNIYLHNMLHDDDDRAPHDHPWWSLSLCLRGTIREIFYYKGVDGLKHDVQYIEQGDWVWRGTDYIHRLELPVGGAWTLFITGPRVREWGFWCKTRFVPWDEFVDPKDPGLPGRGCGEN